jgi:PfaD family protein
LLAELVRRGDLTPGQARLAARVPMAQDLTAEADSGGHTDNRPAITLLPTLLALRDRLQVQYGYDRPLRVGLAGGIATPAAAAAAFVMGAAYVLTGSINQACVESGSSDAVREMLAQAEQADCAMAPAADMFEMGVKVQVLKRGTLFAMRAGKLYELYRAHAGLDDLPAAERANLEKNLFRAPLEEIWTRTRAYFLGRDPAQVGRAEREPKHKMALVFRWYLGQSSRWANAGEPARKLDYQVWCGPAMGAFNEWARGTFLEQPRNRRVATVARNLLYGAAVLLRLQTLRCQGVPLDPAWSRLAPLGPEELAARLDGNGE